jgi:hypothetical protein
MATERKRWTDGNAIALVSASIALMSLGAAGLQNYNYSRSIDSVQRNVLRAETLRTCKEMIDIFFRFRLKAEMANLAQAGGMEAVETKALAYQFGALGTFMANFRQDTLRSRYAALSWHLNRISEEAARLPKADFDKLFEEADKQFSAINDDCVKAAQGELP